VLLLAAQTVDSGLFGLPTGRLGLCLGSPAINNVTFTSATFIYDASTLRSEPTRRGVGIGGDDMIKNATQFSVHIDVKNRVDALKVSHRDIIMKKYPKKTRFISNSDVIRYLLDKNEEMGEPKRKLLRIPPAMDQR
jgi:hypothetical protein